jgi:hypothetical protein
MMIAVALASVLLSAVILSFRPGPCRLTVVNRSGQPIPQLTVTVWGERMVIQDLEDGSSVTVPFPGRASPQFSIAVALADKTPIRSAFWIMGDPKRFGQYVGSVGPDGRFQLSVVREDEPDGP